MSDEDSDDKQFEASQKKLDDARKKGNVFKSKDVTQLIVQIAGFVLLFLFGENVYKGLTQLCIKMWENIPNFDKLSTGFIPFHSWMTIVTIVVPTLIFLASFAVIIEMIQLGGPLFTTEPMQFKLDKLNPVNGLKNMFNVKSLFELFKGMIKIICVGLIAFSVVQAHFPRILGNITAGSKIAGFISVGAILFEFFWKSSIFLLSVAIVDFLFQRWKYMKDQKMSFKEMKDEYKNSEGDPLVKSKRKQRQREIAMGETGGGMAQVPEADFVVKNPDHIAIAVKYNEEFDKAPKILAKGGEMIAEQIIEIAEAYDIPVVTNIPLSRALFRLVRINHEIPPDLYKAVAEVLLFVYKLKKSNFS